MAVVPWIDIATVAWDAGFRGDAHAIAVALTHPESGRIADRVNPNDPNGGSFGLWQINGVHDPKAAGTYPSMVPTQEWIDRMFIPAENAKAAYKIWSTQGFEPWGAYTSNLHLSSLDAARCALDARMRIARLDALVDHKTRQIDAVSAELREVETELAIAQDRIAGAVARLTGS